ncbi:MAG: response regulator [Beijerinckiaceae bacterium]
MMQHQFRILIVEDQFLIAKQVEMILLSSGHHVVGTASTMDEALELAQSARPDLALIDLSLADGVTGGAIGKFIIDEFDADVVFTTANARRLPDDYCGAIGVVEKPFSRNDLLATMAYLTARLRTEGHDEEKIIPSFPAKPNGLQLSPYFEARWYPASAA